jgi:hypothetical protein
MATNSNTTGTHHDETAGQLNFVLGYECHHSLRESLASLGRITNKDHSAGRLCLRIDQLAEILILGQKDQILTQSHVHDRGVVSTRRQLSNRERVMTYSTKRSNDGEVATFIGKESHGLALGSLARRSTNQHRLLMGYGVGGIANGSLDIGFRESGVGVKQISFGGTLTKLPKNQLHGNACATDDRLAHHHFGIHLNAIRRHVRFLSETEYSRLVRINTHRFASTDNRLWHFPRLLPRLTRSPTKGKSHIDTWWDYRAGNFHKNFGMRIDHLLVTTSSLRHRVVWAEIDREARKGKPVPSDHAPLVIDIDSPGYPFDAGWSFRRIAARLPKQQ